MMIGKTNAIGGGMKVTNVPYLQKHTIAAQSTSSNWGGQMMYVNVGSGKFSFWNNLNMATDGISEKISIRTAISSISYSKIEGSLFLEELDKFGLDLKDGVYRVLISASQTLGNETAFPLSFGGVNYVTIVNGVKSVKSYLGNDTSGTDNVGIIIGYTPNSSYYMLLDLTKIS